MTVHATCVAIGDKGVLILGPPGSGKSDLALRLIDGGALLVADDRVEIRRDGGLLFASAPPSLAGKLEVRGLGIVDLPHAASVAVGLAVRLTAESERMPEERRHALLGLELPMIDIDPRQPSAPAKVRVAVRGL
jgi:serine kinase of HPr protein (carbohydrate metabolism regulator)